jgi:hypothetical protein
VILEHGGERAPPVRRPRIERGNSPPVSLAFPLIQYRFTMSLISLLTVPQEDDPVEAATVVISGFAGRAVSLGVMA